MRILEAREIPPGGWARVELRFARPIAAAPGDRFVLRRLSPVTTIGGGVVLDLRPTAFPGRDEEGRRRMLDQLESGALADRLVLWIEESRDHGVDEEELARRAGTAPGQCVRPSPRLSRERRVHALRRSPDRYVSESALVRLAALAASELERFVAEGSGAVGVSRQTLLKRILPRADPRWAEAIKTALAARGALAIVGDEARPPGRSDLAGADLSCRSASRRSSG